MVCGLLGAAGGRGGCLVYRLCLGDIDVQGRDTGGWPVVVVVVVVRGRGKAVGRLLGVSWGRMMKLWWR